MLVLNPTNRYLVLEQMTWAIITYHLRTFVCVVYRFLPCKQLKCVISKWSVHHCCHRDCHNSGTLLVLFCWQKQCTYFCTYIQLFLLFLSRNTQIRLRLFTSSLPRSSSSPKGQQHDRARFNTILHIVLVDGGRCFRSRSTTIQSRVVAPHGPKCRGVGQGIS